MCEAGEAWDHRFSRKKKQRAHGVAVGMFVLGRTHGNRLGYSKKSQKLFRGEVVFRQEESGGENKDRQKQKLDEAN